jgi:hypothetical protein
MRHYQTWHWRERRGAGEPCCIAGCEGDAKTKGMCGRHYSKWQKYGDALGGKTNSPRGGGTLRKDGYRIAPTGRLHHREVAASMLGRPLLQSEVVHHIDGNPSNNDPGNLIVFASQAEHAAHHAALRRQQKEVRNV